MSAVGDDRRVRIITPSGAVTTLAGGSTSGNSDGTGALASFALARSVGVAPNGDAYVADGGRLRKVTAAGAVTTLAESVFPAIRSVQFCGGDLYASGAGTQVIKITPLRDYRRSREIRQAPTRHATERGLRSSSRRSKI